MACLNLRLMLFACAAASGLFLGCGTRSSPPRQPATGGETKQDPQADAARHDAIASANAIVRQGVELARVHLKHGEHDAAEKALMTALETPNATDKTPAIQLLDEVKTARSRKRSEQPSTVDQRPSSPKPSSGRRVANSAPPTTAAPATAAQAANAKQVTADSEPANNSKAESASPAEQAVHDDDPPSDETPRQPAAGQNAIVAEVVVLDEPQPPPAVIDESVPKQDASEADIKQLETLAGRARTAAEAKRLYDHFNATHIIPAAFRDAFDKAYSEWKAKAAASLVRRGKKWVTPAEAAAMESQAELLVTQAIELMAVSNFKQSRVLLEKASRTDPEGVRADFLLGILNCVAGFYHPPTAEKHFQEVVNRVPNHVAALNNLAVSEVRQNKFTEALAHWKQLSTIAPSAPDATHNIGRVISEASKGRIQVRPELLARYSEFYADLVATKKGPTSDPKVGWLYSPLVSNAAAPKNNNNAPPQGGNAAKPVAFSSGTGFVVHDHYIVTNRHVVAHQTLGMPDIVRIIDPADPDHQRELDAKIVATASDVDLALLQCDSLKAPALTISADVPRRGTEILVVGFPETQLLGRSIKSTRGAIVGLPDPSTDGQIMFDATANHGNSGGPVCNEYGSVVAVCTTGIFGIEGKLAAGVPCNVIHKFCKKQLPKMPQPQAAGTPLPWPDVDEQVAKSTVMIVIYRQPTPIAFGPNGPQKTSRSYLEDVTCNACGGGKYIPCSAKGCNRGAVGVRVTAKNIIQFGKQQIEVSKPQKVLQPCPTCRGSGRVDCPHCTNGTDPDTR